MNLFKRIIESRTLAIIVVAFSLSTGTIHILEGNLFGVVISQFNIHMFLKQAFGWKRPQRITITTIDYQAEFEARQIGNGKPLLDTFEV